jgi:hypothetical protein
VTTKISESALAKPRDHAPGRAPEHDGYAVYDLTPNYMWEEAWIRHLLAELPIARWETRDISSLPLTTVRGQRRRRLEIFLESLLPESLRPSRRRVERVVKPHDRCICVYSTFRLDRAVRNELTSVLSRYSGVGIVSSDERTVDCPEAYERVAFAVRIGFGAPKYRGVRGLVVVPLGVPVPFVPPTTTRPITSRTFAWSFLGEIKNESRENMVSELERVRGERFVHAISAWNADDSIRGAQYSAILADSVFVPSPPANLHEECYRTYEALECGAIPVVETEYYRESFGAPFPVVQPSWSDAPDRLNALLADAPALERLQRECHSWWESAKRDYPRRITSLADEARALEGRGGRRPEVERPPRAIP